MSRTGVTPENLKELRRRLAMSQERFSRHVGVARNTVARWEITLPSGRAMHEPRGRVRTVVRGMLRRQGLLDERLYGNVFEESEDDEDAAG